MGVIELLLSLLFAVGGGAALVVGLVIAARRQHPPPPTRPPLPRLPLVVALLSLIAAPALGLQLGGLALEHLLLPWLSTQASLVMTAPQDPHAAQLRCAGLVTLWMALPGLLAVGWLLLSRTRSGWSTLLLGSLGWLGFGAGMAFAWWLVLPQAMDTLGASMPGASVDLVPMVGAVVAGLAALGTAGACGPVVWLLAGSSRRALGRMVLATAAMPAGALIVAALTTPPDVLSQLILATLIGLAWLVGLAGGAVTVALRGRG